MINKIKPDPIKKEAKKSFGTEFSLIKKAISNPITIKINDGFLKFFKSSSKNSPQNTVYAISNTTNITDLSKNYQKWY